MRSIPGRNGNGSNGNAEATGADVSYIQRKIKDVAGEFMYQQTRRRPMVLPVVMEV